MKNGTKNCTSKFSLQHYEWELSRPAEIILAGTVLKFGAKIIAGKFNNIKNKMADQIKLEAIKS